MSRRALTLVLASLLVFALGVIGTLAPVPYVILRPGPTADTLGTLKGKPLIKVEGRKTYPTQGHLNLVTVAYQGGPGSRVDLFTALRGWVNPDIAVVPEETIFPRAESVKEVERQNTEEMEDSQQAAIAAALRELGYPVRGVVVVAGTEKGLPAAGLLQVGDEIVEVDGRSVTGIEAVAGAVRRHRPGEEVVFTIRRNGTDTHRVAVRAAAGKDSRALVGVVLRSRFKFPFTVEINVGEVGGPSAGLMFALGIVDKLTPGELTGGRSIAGTGSITPDGEVDPIGGIQQKMIGARQAGAQIFLTPEENCADGLRAAPKGLRLVRVTTLHEALSALEALRTGQGSVPSCTLP